MLKAYLAKSVLMLTFFMFALGHAQMGVQNNKIEDVKLFKEKPLLVVLAREDSKLASQNFNEHLKKAVNAIWTFSPSVEFISQEDYDTLLEDETKSSNYAYLDFLASNINGNAPGNSFIIGFLNKRVSPHYTTIYTLDDTYTYGDIFFYLTLLHNDLNNAVNIDKKVLKKQRNSLFRHLPLASVDKKTLLIDENIITEDLKEEIANLYDYNYKIVSKEIIDNAITERQINTIIFRKTLSVPRPVIRTTPGNIINGSRHSNGMLKRGQDQIKSSGLNAIYFNSLFDTETGKIIFFGRPSFKDKKIDVKDFKIVNKAIN